MISTCHGKLGIRKHASILDALSERSRVAGLVDDWGFWVMAFRGAVGWEFTVGTGALILVMARLIDGALRDGG
jgi:hypothetical protein